MNWDWSCEVFINVKMRICSTPLGLYVCEGCAYTVIEPFQGSELPRALARG